MQSTVYLCLLFRLTSLKQWCLWCDFSILQCRDMTWDFRGACHTPWCESSRVLVNVIVTICHVILQMPVSVCKYLRALRLQVATRNETTTGTMQCMSCYAFLHRPSMIQEMFVRARALGLEPYGSNDSPLAVQLDSKQRCPALVALNIVWF